MEWSSDLLAFMTGQTAMSSNEHIEISFLLADHSSAEETWANEPLIKRRHVVLSVVTAVSLAVAVGMVLHQSVGHTSEADVSSRSLDTIALQNTDDAKIFRDGFWHLSGLGQDRDCDCSWITNEEKCLKVGRCFEPCKELNKDMFCKFDPGHKCDCSWMQDVEKCQLKGKCHEQCFELHKDMFCKFDNTIDYPGGMDKYFEDYKKNYSSLYEWRIAQANVKHNDNAIAAYNKRLKEEGASLRLGHNQYSDMNWEDFAKAILIKWQEDLQWWLQWPYYVPPLGLEVPPAWNWAETPCRAEVKNQAGAGTCWAFAATTALEMAMCRYYGWSTEVQLSPQQLVECDARHYEKCMKEEEEDFKECGDWFGRVFDFNRDNDLVAGSGNTRHEHEALDNDKGLRARATSEYEYTIGYDKHYQYTSYRDNCREKGKTVVLKKGSIQHLLRINKWDDNALKAAVSHVGPVVVALEVDGDWWWSLVFAQSGMYESTGGLHYKGNDDKANSRIDSNGVMEVDEDSSYRGGDGHAVLVVGYGSDIGGLYWIIQNSWGTTWAEFGFLKVRSDRTFWEHLKVSAALSVVLDPTNVPHRPGDAGTCCYVSPEVYSPQILKTSNDAVSKICQARAHCTQHRWCDSQARCLLPARLDGCDASSAGASNEWLPVWCEY